MNRRSIFTIVVFALLMFAGIYYARLGGFNEMKTEVAEQPPLFFTGKSYYGLSADDSLKAIMDQMFRVVKSEKLQGDFSVCFFGNPDSEKDSLWVWVGATTNDNPLDVPADYNVMELPAKKVLRATINAYSIVAPNPNKVNERLMELADANGLQADSIYLERYPSPEQIFNEIYVK